MPQAEVWILSELRAEQASEVKHLVYLRPGLDRTRSFNAHVVDRFAGAYTQGVDEVTRYQDTFLDSKNRTANNT